jgi:hypothetical protein
MNTKRMTTGQIKQLLEIDFKRGIRAEIQELIARLTLGGIKSANPQQFFQELYDEIFPGMGIKVPTLPEVAAEQEAALKQYPQLIWFYFPQVAEKDYPAEFVKPKWGRYLNESEIKRVPLEGRWVLTDTTPKPDWDDADAYTDQLTKDLGLKTRFGVSWNDCVEKHFPAIKKLVHAKEVQHMTVEEWNFFANVMIIPRLSRGMDLPDLGSTRSVEWCANGYNSARRLYVGSAGHGGLASVRYSHVARAYGLIGFRFLAVL